MSSQESLAEPMDISFNLNVFADQKVDDEINQFISNSKNKNTVYSTNQGCNRLNEFLKKQYPNESRPFWELSNKQIDTLMCQFFMKAAKKALKKSSGDNLYEPDTLNNFRNSW